MESKKVDYALLALLFGSAYALVKYALPALPLDQDTAFVLFLFILSQLGVEVIGKPALRKLQGK